MVTASALTINVFEAALLVGIMVLAVELGRNLSRRVHLPIRRHCWICRERLCGPWHARYCPSSHRHIERLFRH